MASIYFYWHENKNSSDIQIGNIKEINITNWTYYGFNDIINIENFNPNLFKIEKKSYKNIDIYYIGYITIKYISEIINSVNPLYFIVGKTNEHIEEKNGNKYLVFDYTNKNKGELEEYTELWDRIKSQIKTIDNKPSNYEKDSMKIKFYSDDKLLLNKPPNVYNLTVVTRSVFEEDGKYYPQFSLDKCLYEL